MLDGYCRNINYLRISVTDRCNLRCRYCMPEDGVTKLSHGDILTFDEITRVVRIMTGLGITRVRLTGGEPLVRRNIPALAADIKSLGVDFLGLTTNGVLLDSLGAELLAAGIDGINISIDTTDPARYAFFTQRDDLTQALTGLHTALDLGFKSVKVNAVLSPVSLESDWLGVVALAEALPVDVRLIEWMPMAEESGTAAISSDAALELIEKRFGKLRPLARSDDEGPAQCYAIDGFKGRVGVIPAMSHRFCDGCNRLRLTAGGDLKLCLFYDEGVALKPLLRGGATDSEIKSAIEIAVQRKPEGHLGKKLTAADGGVGLIDHPCGMWAIGG